MASNPVRDGIDTLHSLMVLVGLWALDLLARGLGKTKEKSATTGLFLMVGNP